MIRPTLLVAATLALSACSTSSGSGPSARDLRVAGGPAGSGGVCAYYSGTQTSGRLAPNRAFARRACFPSRAQCRSWYSSVQSRFPNRRFSKGCR